jgi:hypothetical protein
MVRGRGTDHIMFGGVLIMVYSTNWKMGLKSKMGSRFKVKTSYVLLAYVRDWGK